ncbi:MAG: 4'-phosphopantetheinyl transferase superfamily protein [Candidatus Azobacteroides sp.]|nr:4'-phosphopantetheinyl transferase superfamily protein [Candidatus Azobacteroides sp.]
MGKSNDIAIVGMSCYFPGANNIGEFWNNLVNGVCSITDVPEDRIDPVFFINGKPGDIDHFYFNKGGFVSPIKINPLEYGLLPLAAQGIDPEHLVALHLVKEALTDAGVYEKNIPLKNCCFILGKGNYAGVAQTRIGGYTFLSAVIESIAKYLFPELTAEDMKAIREEYQATLGRYQADTAAGSMPNLVVSLVANKFDLKGPAYTIDGACASSLLAVEHAANLLLSDQCDIALAGGMHLGQGVSFWSVFNVIGAATSKGVMAPFSETADGLLIGEGAGIVVLKKLDKAIADNDRIYAVIKAYGSRSDGSDVSILAPSSKGQVETLKQTWAKSGMDPKKLGYLETHGTATQAGDWAEMNTITEFFGDKTAPPALLGSVKANIGHIMPAAGIAGLIKTALALYYRKIPPTLNCEKPMKAMFESRFMPAQQLTDWDEEKYPLVAAINAFGFGGINTHAILEPYREKEKTSVHINKAELIKDKVICLSAQTKEELLSKLGKEDYTVSKGNYRLVVFNPTADRLEKAKSLVQKDQPWRGKSDIWFSGQPMSSEGGKVAFMFAGFDPNGKMEIQSVSDYFGIPLKQVVVKNDSLAGHSINHFCRSLLLDEALKKIGLTPDIYIGHSTGEWIAAGAARYITLNSIERLFEDYDPEKQALTDVIYIAVECGYDKVKPWCKEIKGLYLANDNCRNQILIAGKEDSINRFTERLREEQISYRILPFKSGFHTPLFPKEFTKRFESLCTALLEPDIRGGAVPLWSSTTLQEYPKDIEDIFALFSRHLRETVRFRELIEILYNQENIRVFVQVGIGPLTGFTEDILKEKNSAVISTVHPSLSGLEQIRRIAALMFIEGKPVNKELIGIVEEESSLKQNKMEITLDFSVRKIQELPAMQRIMNRQIEKKAAQISTVSAPAFSVKEIEGDAVLQEANENLREIAALQESMLKWYQTNGRPVQKIQSESYPAPVDSGNRRRAGTKIEQIIRFTLEDHPYLLDHMVVRQPENCPLEEKNPVVPFAMTVETLCEQAQALIPGKKVLRVSSAGVQKWISVKEPFEAKITGEWKTDDCISWMLPDHVFGDITLGDTFPPVPEEYTKEIDLGDNILPALPQRKQIYSYFLFHEPRYQSILEILNLTKTGLRARICKTEGKGSMLDNLGQLLGFYCYMVLKESRATFPMGLDELIFYQDFRDQKGVFDYTMVVKEIKEYDVISNVIIKRDGKVWCVANGWHNRRFDYSAESMNLIIRPKEFILADEPYDNVFSYFFDTRRKVSVLDFFYERVLNSEERRYFQSLYPNQAREYLISRIALKDGVRKFIQKREGGDLIYPIEIAVRHDEQGKPYVFGHEKVKGIEVSVAHKGNGAVAIISDKPVGIDLEKIEPRNKEFTEISFTPHELDLLKTKKDETEWITRFWVAKEAYVKMLGVGLQGNPKQYEIESVTGEDLKIKNTVITTKKYRDDFIIGWTI